VSKVLPWTDRGPSTYSSLTWSKEFSLPVARTTPLPVGLEYIVVFVKVEVLHRTKAAPKNGGAAKGKERSDTFVAC
jgi:hypothetical protein